jgi:hypothetical protein
VDIEWELSGILWTLAMASTVTKCMFGSGVWAVGVFVNVWRVPGCRPAGGQRLLGAGTRKVNALTCGLCTGRSVAQCAASRRGLLQLNKLSKDEPPAWAHFVLSKGTPALICGIRGEQCCVLSTGLHSSGMDTNA